MSGCGWEPLSDVRVWLGGPPRFTAVVGSPSRMSESGREAPLDVREWSRGPNGRSGDSPKCAGVVGRSSRMSGRDRETLPDVQEWSGCPPECP